MKNKKWSWIVDVIYWGIILYSAFSELLDDVSIGEVKQLINYSATQGVSIKEISLFILAMFGMLIMSVAFSLLSNFLFTAIYIGFKLANRKHRKDKLEKVDFKNDSYYREIIPAYSPAVLSYIDDFKLDRKDIVATLLGLELKKKIIIKDEIEIIDNTKENLNDNEIYILESISNNTLKDINIRELENIVSKECKEKGLTKEKQVIKDRLNRIMWTSIAMCVIVSILLFWTLGSILAFAEEFNEALLVVVALGIMAIIILGPLVPGIIYAYMVRYSILNTINPYIRSKLGSEVNVKLEGLKKYITEFSLIEEKTKDDLILWEDYLIYSVMFGINDKVVDEVYAKIK